MVVKFRDGFRKVGYGGGASGKNWVFIALKNPDPTLKSLHSLIHGKNSLGEVIVTILSILCKKNLALPVSRQMYGSSKFFWVNNLGIIFKSEFTFLTKGF